MTGVRDCENFREEISTCSWDVNTAIDICNIESGGNVYAHNGYDYHSQADCYGSDGLFQIGCVHGYSKDYLQVPQNNIDIACNLWENYGWTPWKNSLAKLTNNT